LLRDSNASSDVRLEALRALFNQKDPVLAEALALALADKDQKVRLEASRIQAQLHPDAAMENLRVMLGSDSVSEKQNALAIAGTLGIPAADDLILEWLGRLMGGQVQPELQLDVLDAAAKRTNRVVQTTLRQFESNRPAGDDLRSYRECLVGGNAEAGQRIFLEKPEVSCVRCHRLNGEGGEVGPEVTGVGARQTREYLLESIVFPNKHIAAGFESVLITMKNGTGYAGTLKSETTELIEVNSPEDGLLRLKKEDIQTRERGLSGMPEELRQVLTRQELRDLVEFLSGLQDEPKPAVSPPIPAE
jgi:quinoprotein glucose dehydrogenase